MRGPALLAAALAAMPVPAQSPQAFADADAQAGQRLVERDCVECHVRRFGAAATIYTRPDRRVRTPEQLLAQVQVCNVELKSGYFPDEEAHVAAYLNQAYYRFRP